MISIESKSGPEKTRAAGAGRGERGFTLVELIVVVVIIGLLAALVVPKFFGKVEQSKVKAAMAQIELFGAALDQYRLDVGSYPQTAEGLDALRTKRGEARNWSGPYVKKEIPADPWGNKYFYSSPGEHDDYDLLSHGADGQSGGEGENRDITSWGGTK